MKDWWEENRRDFGLAVFVASMIFLILAIVSGVKSAKVEKLEAENAILINSAGVHMGDAQVCNEILQRMLKEGE